MTAAVVRLPPQVVYPGMPFRLRNTTLLFNGAAGVLDVRAPDLSPHQDACQTTTVPGARGHDYSGNVSVSRSGSPCMNWGSVNLPGFDFGHLEGSFCR